MLIIFLGTKTVFKKCIDKKILDNILSSLRFINAPSIELICKISQRIHYCTKQWGYNIISSFWGTKVQRNVTTTCYNSWQHLHILMQHFIKTSRSRKHSPFSLNITNQWWLVYKITLFHINNCIRLNISI